MKKNNKKEKCISNDLIGVLLLMPLYIVVFTLFFVFKLHGKHDYILLPILLYVPIIAGVVLTYKKDKKKFNKTIGVLLLLFCMISLYFYIDTYFITKNGIQNICQYLLWVINTGIVRVLACFLYARFVGYRKSIIMFLLYAAVMVVSYSLGFWA